MALRRPPTEGHSVATAPVENLTVPEAAEWLRIHRDTLYQLFRSGEIRKTKVRGRTLVRRRELERFLDRNTQGKGA